MSSLSLQNYLASSQLVLKPMLTNPKGFKAAIQSLSDFLVAHQVSATLWLKLPKDDAWWTDIWQYGRQAVGCTIYSLGTQTGSPPENMAASLRPIPIEQDADLKREYLCLAVADSLVVALLAVRNPNATDKRTLQLYCTVSGQAISALATGIKTILERSQSASDNKPLASQNGSNISADNELSNSLSSIASSDLDTRGDRSEQEIAGQAALSQWTRLFPTNVLLQPTHSLDNAFLSWQLQAQENLRLQLAEQTKANDALDALAPNFLSQANQELQAPLTTIKTALTLLGSPTIKLSQRQLYLEMIATQCDRQRSLIESIFDLLKVQTSPAVSVEPLKLSELIPGIVSTYQPLAEERGVMLAYTVPPNLPEATGVEASLKEALIHLIENGITVAQEGGRVWVTAALADRDTLFIKVKDSGTGVSKSDANRLFDAFYRSGEGAGLGLTLSKQLIEKMGGSLEVESQGDRGTTFKIQLSVHQETSNNDRTSGNTTPTASSVTASNASSSTSSNIEQTAKSDQSVADRAASLDRASALAR